MKSFLLFTFGLCLLTVLCSLSRAEEPKPSDPKADLKTLVQGNNQFAFDLYSRLAKEEGNIVFSPYSISTALAMTYAGARGETAAQMSKVLHFTLGQERLHPAFGELMADLQKNDKELPYHLYTANALWGQKEYPFRPQFLQLTQKDYRAGLKDVDFAEKPEAARQTINRWVEEQTKDKIKELLKEGDVTGTTRLVLTNAIYFKATWEYPFPKDQTKEAVFEVSATEKPTVPMMHHKELRLNYFEGEGFQWLELPYQGDRLAMLVLLSQKKGQLADLEKTLTASVIEKGVKNLSIHQGSVALPRFKATFRCLLAKDLVEMGMPLAFSEDADFSGIVSGGGLRISTVIHKAFIDVDEVGTEAAAATAVGLNESEVPSFSFRADRPFLYVIRDKKLGSILFQGRVSDPR
jgi:serpin B